MLDVDQQALAPGLVPGEHLVDRPHLAGGDADLGQAGTLAGLRVAVDLAERSAGVFHDPFDDADPDRDAAPAPRLVLLGTGEEDPQAVSRRTLGREWPNADVAHPVEEVPRGTRDAVLLRAAVLALRVDIAAVYLGLAGRAALGT